MLELLKEFHHEQIWLPARAAQRPDRERLAERFASFVQSGGRGLGQSGAAGALWRG